MSGSEGQWDRAGWRILFAGTGGQGVLTAAKLLCECMVELGHDVVSGQLHGMAQRGGAVQSSVIIDGGISPVIPEGRADFVVGFEPVETARALALMSVRTIVYANIVPVVPFVLAQRAASKKPGTEYPDVDGLVERIRGIAPNVMAFDATKCAAEAGSVRALNMVMLGCLVGSGLLPCSAELFRETVAKRFPPALRQINVDAFARGAEFSAAVQVGGEAS